MRALVLSALMLVGCGATIDEPSICKTLHDQAVPGAEGLKAVTLPIALDLRPELKTLGVTEGRAELSQVTLHVVDGVSDLGFLTSLRVNLLQPSDGGELQLIDYEGVTAPSTLVLDGGGGDILPEALAGPLQLQLSLVGDLPDATWHADVSVCLSAQADVGLKL